MNLRLCRDDWHADEADAFRSWRVAYARFVGGKNTNNGWLRPLPKWNTNNGTKLLYDKNPAFFNGKGYGVYTISSWQDLRDLATTIPDFWKSDTFNFIKVL